MRSFRNSSRGRWRGRWGREEERRGEDGGISETGVLCPETGLTLDETEELSLDLGAQGLV